MSYVRRPALPQIEGTAISTGWSGATAARPSDDPHMMLAALLAAFALGPVAAPPKPPAPSPAIAYGAVTVCAAAGSRPISGPLSFTLSAAAAAGGTQTVAVAI